MAFLSKSTAIRLKNIILYIKNLS